MMIRIERLSGPDAGRTTTHAATERIAFGRAAQCTVRLGGDHISRHHGELAWHGEQWLLTCHSENGLRVGRRKIGGGQTLAMDGPTTVSVQGQPLFAMELVHAGPGQTGEPATATVTASAATGALGSGGGGATLDSTAAAGEGGAEAGRVSRRGKIWLGIGAYLLLLIVAFGVLSGISAQRDGDLAMPAQLPDQRIAAEVREPVQRVPNDRESQRHLAQAQRWYARSDSSPEGLFLAHYHYKLARAYAGLEVGDPLEEGLDQLRYQEVEQRLIRRLQRDYREAFALAHNREWQAAERALRTLLLSYTPPPDQPSAIVDNLEQQLRVVMRSKPRQQFR